MKTLRATFAVCFVFLALSSPVEAAQVTLSWTPPTQNVDGSLLPAGELGGYRLYYGPQQQPPYDGTGFFYDGVIDDSPVDVPTYSLPDPFAPSVTLTGIPSCTEVYFAATAYNVTNEESDYSNTVLKVVLDPPARVSLTPTGGVGELQVSWDPIVDGGTTAGFNVYYGTSPGDRSGTGAAEGPSPVAAGPADSSLLLTGLTVSTTYYVAVEVLCGAGAAEMSEEASALAIDCATAVCGDESDGCCPSLCSYGTDTDCPPVCGNGLVEPGETCDGNCVVACDDADNCTVDFTSGTAESCDFTCNTPPSGCASGDGCCPTGCNGAEDQDCPSVCGNGVTEPGETCDGDCPTTCTNSDPCTTVSLVGDAGSCDVECVAGAPVDTCTNGDGCCPTGCSSADDDDCSSTCGDGITQSPAETCDGDCPTDCDDLDPCTADTMSGSAANCNVTCSHQSITQCAGGDTCCPAGCNSLADTDCAIVCGNGITEVGETCDGNCPASCDDGDPCTGDSQSGSSGTCDLSCSNTLIDTCISNDSCCPPGCDRGVDNDCASDCGNGVIDPGETCDGTCPSDCPDDGNVCTSEHLLGNALACDAECVSVPIDACADGDGCCPTGCGFHNDDDCPDDPGGTAASQGCSCADGGLPYWPFIAILWFWRRRRT